VNIAKWGAMLNYSYLPADEADHKRHQKLLRDYGVSDVKALARFRQCRGSIPCLALCNIVGRDVREMGDLCHYHDMLCRSCGIDLNAGYVVRNAGVAV
ncbi:MAG: DUF3841 domain-containing protein, partial [Alistipes sp.]|nr:DUF3841 domain-containing protein [Alistipes sp.]